MKSSYFSTLMFPFLVCCLSLNTLNADESKKVLILSDQSAGAALPAMVWNCLGQNAGWDLTVESSPAAFVERIHGDSWNRIMVFHQSSATEPAFINTLRTWSSDHPQRPVILCTWRVPEGTVIQAGKSLVASTSFCIWLNNRSVIGYSVVKPSEASKTVEHPGLLWADFDGIDLEVNPLLLGTVATTPQPCFGSSVHAAALAVVVTISPCRTEAIEKFLVHHGIPGKAALIFRKK